MKQITPGAWETGPDGRRFRRIGNAIEYEPTVTVDGINIPQSELEDFNRRRNSAEQAAAIQTAPAKGICPFKKQRNRIANHCEQNCSFYGDTACILAAETHTKDTQGRYCPIAGRCTTDCVMYKNGCSLIECIKGMKPGKDQ